MKITKQLLRKLIKEEMETLSQEQKAISAEEAESAALAVDRAEDIVPVENAWDGGANLVHPTDFEAAALDGEKPVHGQQILKVVESFMLESYMKGRMIDIESSILDAIGDEPGIEGMKLASYVVSDSSSYGHEVPVEQDEVFAVLDIMLEDGTVFFDEEEDAWFTSLEDLTAWKEGGVWSDDKDYDAGFYR